MSSISNKSRGKMPWLPLYTADLITDSAVCRCSFETRGVWVWMLCAAWKEKVRGTLPGDMDELSSIAFVPIQILSTAVKDLEIHGVFSRGRDFDGHGLPPDAIVNRRMYGDWRLEQMKVKAGRKGGKASAEKRRIQAKAQQNASNARTPNDAQVIGLDPTTPSTAPSKGTSTLLDRISAVTGDGPEWMSWFKAALEVMAGFGGTPYAEAAVLHVERSGDIEHPGRFLADKFLRWARENKMTGSMPKKPTI